MKIISKKTEKDYYDNGSVYGIDETKVYVRMKESITLKREDFKINNLSYGFWSHFEVLGFCGEIYLLENYSKQGFGSDWDRHPKDFILINEEILQYKFIEIKNNLTTDYRKVKLDKEGIKKRKRAYNYSNINEVLKNLNKSKNLTDLFIKYKTPIFHLKNLNWDLELTINPLLKDFGFFRIKDTIQAFQEIEMYLGSVLVSDTQVEVPVGDDNTIRNSKGFDKWSFRKEPTTRKKT